MPGNYVAEPAGLALLAGLGSKDQQRNCSAYMDFLRLASYSTIACALAVTETIETWQPKASVRYRPETGVKVLQILLGGLSTSF